ncbi:MAG: hypothetical protein ACP5XB_10770 [Isosphaeraceae bacterium]
MDDELAFGMLDQLRREVVRRGDRRWFAELVEALRDRLPEVFNKSASYYLNWCLLDALAEDRYDALPALARDLAVRAGQDIDTVNLSLDYLRYHGQLDLLVECSRIAWPVVKSSTNIVPWGVTEFAKRAVHYEIFHYLEHTSSPGPADPALLDRIHFLIEDPRADYLGDFLVNVTGTSGREWRTEDFALSSPRSKHRDDWDDDEGENEEAPEQGEINLFRLITEFVGYLRREEGVPFTRGDLVSQELTRYFTRRRAGNLDPRPSMLEQMMHPDRKLPKPRDPTHPLCPDRVTLDVHLGSLMGMMSGRYHAAAALFQAMPAWLRFLESRRLINADISKKVRTQLLPIHEQLLGLWEQYTGDPHLYRQEQECFAQ